MKQIARNLTAADDGFLEGKRYVLMDRDAKFSAAFRNILEESGVEPMLLPPRSPNLNAHIERFHRSLKEECLDRMIFFGEESSRKAVVQFLEATTLGLCMFNNSVRPCCESNVSKAVKPCYNLKYIYSRETDNTA